MLNEMMGDPEENYIIHWWEFECDEFDFYSCYAWQVNCPKCKQRLTQRAPDAGESAASTSSLQASSESASEGNA